MYLVFSSVNQSCLLAGCVSIPAGLVFSKETTWYEEILTLSLHCLICWQVRDLSLHLWNMITMKYIIHRIIMKKKLDLPSQEHKDMLHRYLKWLYLFVIFIQSLRLFSVYIHAYMSMCLYIYIIFVSWKYTDAYV